MKKYLFIACLFIVSTQLNAQKEKDPAKKLEQAIENFRKALLDGDSLTLLRMTDSGLSYGHSKGKIESQPVFVSALASGRSDFKTIELSDQTITVRGKTAIVRHTLTADAVDNGKEEKIKLAVFMVWIKADKEWKLLGRQAVRL